MGKGTLDELDSTRMARRWYFVLAISAQVSALIAFILITVLLGNYQGGFGWGVKCCCFFLLSIYHFNF